jgi:hypothetical protein
MGQLGIAWADGASNGKKEMDHREQGRVAVIVDSEFEINLSASLKGSSSIPRICFHEES